MKIKLSKSQWEKIGKEAGWTETGIEAYFNAVRQNLQYMQGKIELATSGDGEKELLDLEYLKSNIATALEDLNSLKTHLEKKLMLKLDKTN